VYAADYRSATIYRPAANGGTHKCAIPSESK
jgi:hypothetical protein